MARIPLALATALVTSSTIAACGHTQIVGASRAVHVALTEYRLGPQRVQVGPGRLTIFVKNDGIYTHNLAVTRGSKTLGATQPISPGHRTHLTLTLKKGSYTMTSTMLSDQALGLYGTLIAK
jgi:plastocyanin